MVGRTKSATKSEKYRFNILGREIGCLACYKDSGVLGTPADIHHLLYCGKRISHSHTIPLCPHHHGRQVDKERGKSQPPLTSRTKFVMKYGTENELLTLTNELLAANTINTITAI